jgi:hypothetical protein
MSQPQQPLIHHSGVTRMKALTFYVLVALDEMRRQAFVHQQEQSR